MSHVRENHAQEKHFQQVGRVLSICEVTEFSVGIPWIPPTATVSGLRGFRDNTLEEFVRYSLVEVPTAALESYIDELNGSISESAIHPELNLFAPSVVERNAFPISIFLLFAVFFLLSVQLVGFDPQAALFIGLIAGTICAMGAATLVTDDHRLTTFSTVLYREICRRNGVDPESSGNLQICAT